MAKLSDEEQSQLDALLKKQEAPDEQKGNGRSESIEIIIDLGDENAVARAVKHGFLTADEVEDLKDEDGGSGDDDQGEPDEAPRRKLDRRYS